MLTKKMVNASVSNNSAHRNTMYQKQQQQQDDLNLGSKSVDVKTVNTTSKRPSQPLNKNPQTQAEVKTSSGFFVHPNIRSFAEQSMCMYIFCDTYIYINRLIPSSKSKK